MDTPRGDVGPDDGPPDEQRRREPVQMPWLWVAIVVVILAGVPFYLPTGTIEPLIGGIPAWLWVSIAATAAFSAITCWACLRAWNLVEPEETAAEAAGLPISSVHESVHESAHEQGGGSSS